MPNAVSTRQIFSTQHGQALKVESRGSVYYLVHGQRGRTLASGPSGYVFDERGNFVGWIQDTGDDSYLRIVMENDATRTALPADRITPEKRSP